jgi:hypothetical protein
MFTGSIVHVALGTHEICFFNFYIIFSTSLLPYAHVGLCSHYIEHECICELISTPRKKFKKH